MHEERTQKPDPRQTIQKLLQERYPKANTTFWSGSVSKGRGTPTSDLDLIIVYEHLPNAYREAFIYDEWPIDAFIHDPNTLAYFMERIDIPSFAPTLPYMIADGIQIPHETPLGNELKQRAQHILDAPIQVKASDLNSRRFLITDSLDDLKSAQDLHLKLAITFRLYEKLAEFYLLANNQWVGNGKQLAKRLTAFNPDVAKKFCSIFENPLRTPDIITFAEDILKPYGGLLWDGFKSDAPKEFRFL